jgi:hypothetical protein
VAATSAAPRGITLKEIAAGRGVSIHTIRGDRARYSHAFKHVGRRYTGGCYRPEDEFDARAIHRFYAWKETATPQGRRGRKRQEDWDPEERVDGQTAAHRLGIAWSTLRSYPSLYRASANPFPPKGPDGRWQWGDLAAWDDARPGSGRRGPRATLGAASGDGPVPAPSAAYSGQAPSTPPLR